MIVISHDCDLFFSFVIHIDLLAERSTMDNSVAHDDLDSGPLLNNSQQEPNVADVENAIAALAQPFIPEPEAPIDPAECRMRLLEHIEHFQCHLDSRLSSLEAQICGTY